MRPDHAATRYELGRIAYHEKNYPEALKHLIAATKLDPEMREATFLLASTYRQTGKTEEARKEFERCNQLYKRGHRKDIALLERALDQKNSPLGGQRTND